MTECEHDHSDPANPQLTVGATLLPGTVRVSMELCHCLDDHQVAVAARMVGKALTQLADDTDRVLKAGMN